MDSPKDRKHEGELPWTMAAEPPKSTTRLKLIGALFAGLLVLYPLSCSVSSHNNGVHHATHAHHPTVNVCPQVEPRLPSSDANRKLSEELGVAFADSSFEAAAAEYLGAAVRVP